MAQKLEKASLEETGKYCHISMKPMTEIIGKPLYNILESRKK